MKIEHLVCERYTDKYTTMLVQYYFSAQQTITIYNALEDVENATIGFSNPRFNQNEGFREEIEAHALKFRFYDIPCFGYPIQNALHGAILKILGDGAKGFLDLGMDTFIQKKISGGKLKPLIAELHKRGLVAAANQIYGRLEKVYS